MATAISAGWPRILTFTISATDGAARTGIIAVARGEIRTPAFMPVGTAATVKAMKPSPTYEYEPRFNRDPNWTAEMFVETIYRNLAPPVSSTRK